MEPFTIHCTSCTARLKVRRASLINQVLACPKCQNMVKVTAPEGWDLDDETIPATPRPKKTTSSPSQTAATMTSFDDVEDLIQQEQNRPSHRSAPAARSAPPLPKPNPTQSRSTASKPASEQPMLPDQSWTSKQTQGRQKLILSVVAGVSILLLTIAGIAAFVANSKPKDVADQSNDSSKKTEVIADSVPEQNGDESNTNSRESNEPNETSTNNNDVDNASAVPDVGTDDAGTDENGGTEEQNLNGDANQGNAADSEDSTNASDAGTKDPENPLVERTEETNTKKPDVLDLNLDGDSPSSRGALPGDSLVDDSNISTKMGRFNSLLQDAGLTLGEINSVAEANRKRRVGIPKYFIDPPSQTDPQLETVLSNPLDGIKYVDIRLVDFIRDMSNVVGAPVSLHVDSILSEGYELDGKLDITQTGLTVSTAIDQAIQPLHLVKVKTEYGLVILAKDWNKNVERSYTPHRLGDNSPLGQAAFVRKVRGMFTKEAWTDETSIEMKDGQLVVTQNPQVHYQIARLIKKLKAAQTLNSSKQDEAALAVLETEWKSAKDSLAKKINLKVGPDTKIHRFIRRIENQAGVRILIDWNSLSRNGWTPALKVPGNFEESTLEAALDQLSRSLSCTFRAVNETTFELMTFEEASNRAELQVYEVSDIVSGKESFTDLMDTLYQVMQVELNVIQAAFDTDSQSVVVIAPQSVQQQFEAIISRLRNGS